MPTCNILDFSLIQEYYSENVSDPNNPKSSATNLCCYESLPMTYDAFVLGITDLYNSSCLRDREFSDYVTQLFTECLSGSTGGVTKIIAGTNITISPTSGLGDVTINSSGSGGGYWTGNTDGSISNSGLTKNVGIGTHVPSEMLSVSGNTNITQNLYVSGNTFYEGALSGTGNISTLGTVTTSNVITPTISNAAGDQIISVNTSGIDVAGPIDTNNNLYITGNTFYEGALSGTGNISTTDSLLVSGDTYFGSTVDVGIDGTGHDVKFYGDTAGRKFTWDTSRSALNLNDETRLEIGSTADFSLWHDASTNRINLRQYPLTITTGSTPADTVMLINSEQQVGIGTQSGDTTNRLHVSGASRENPVRFQTVQDGEGYILVINDTGVVYKTTSVTSGDTAGYWTGNTDGSISNSGLTKNVGVGTDVPSEMLSVSGNTNISSNLFVSGDTFYEGALSGTGNITTLGDVYTDQIRRATDNSTTTKINLSSSNIIKLFAGNSSNEVMKLESSDVSLPNTTNFISSGNLYVTGNTFYEGTLSGTGNITTVGTASVGTVTYNGASNGGTVVYKAHDDQSADVIVTLPVMESNDEVVTRNQDETLTNKTLTAPTIEQIKPDGSATLTMPTATDTLVGKATTDTLTNKTMGDNLAMGTNKLTGLGDPTADQDAVTRNYLSSTTAETYSYQYVSFFCAVQGANLDDGNWVLPSAGGGISNHTWNNDSGYAGTNDSLGDGPFNAGVSDTHIAIPVPVDGFLVGFQCNCRNNGAASDPRNAALFVSDGAPDYGSTNNTAFYLRAFGAGDAEGGSANSRLYKIDGMLGSGSTVPFAVSKDDVVLPAMCAYDTDNIQAQCTWTVVFKTAVSGTT